MKRIVITLSDDQIRLLKKHFTHFYVDRTHLCGNEHVGVQNVDVYIFKYQYWCPSLKEEDVLFVNILEQLSSKLDKMLH